jgi:carboxyl-terminal processing protease
VRSWPAAVLVAVVFLCAGLYLGGHPDDLPGPVQDLFVDPTASLSSEAAGIIEDDYYRDVPRSEINDGSLAGMIAALRRHNRADRYSQYFNPDQAQLLDEETSGHFSGVGLRVHAVKRGLVVTDVFKGSPAGAAGIKSGDVIVSVNGKSLAGISSARSTAEIKGPEGTEVSLGIQRPPGKEVRHVTVERREIATPTVESSLKRRGGARLGYVHLLGFSEGAHGALRDAVEKLQRRGSKGLVLDLRGNPGGLLSEAVLTSSVFLPKGEKVVSTVARSEGRTVYRAAGDPVRRQPIVVLIDRGTASAAEILASALADNGLAEVVGTRSFGKGLFQSVVDLSNGGRLDLSVGAFFTADGISLAPKGIHPDVFAKDDPRTNPDEALARALGVLGGELGARPQTGTR